MLQKFISSNKEALRSRSTRIGGYSVLITAVVLAIVVAVNVLVSALPATMTQFDVSAAQLYSLTSNTKVVVNNLNKDVKIYWICQAGQEDSVIERLLDVYDAMSDHVTVVKKDPDAYPTFAQQYTSETVSNNSLIVESGDKNRYIPFSSIYLTDQSVSTTSTQSVSYSFDGEALVTSAINYVTSDENPELYVLTGHGETDLSDSATSAIQKQNIDINTLSLLTVDEIPGDCAAILINAPTSDLSEQEAAMLSDYVTNGGHLLVLAGPQESGELSNLNSVLTAYGIQTQEGVVIEADRDHYAFSTPYCLIPDMADSDITTPLLEENSMVIVPIGMGFAVEDPDLSAVTVTSLMTTSSDAFSKTAGYGLTTYEKEDGDIDGPFSLAVSVENQTNDGKIVWVGSSYMLDDTYNSYSSGANMDFVMNSLSWMIGESEPLGIRAKSLDYNYLTITDSQAARIKLVTIVLLPLFCLLYGLNEVLHRRKVQ